MNQKIIFTLVAAITIIGASTTVFQNAEAQNLIPTWIKNNAAWWAEDTIDDATFLQGIEYLVENNIINVSSESKITDVDSITIGFIPVEKALLADPEKKAEPPENPMSADRVKWEHIHRVFELCNRNVSETARRLKMHRRTLQRILSKRSPK